MTGQSLDAPDGLRLGFRDEARRTAGVTVRPGQAYGFFTDTTLCIGCKACEVACKQWNNLPADVDFAATSYVTGRLGHDRRRRLRRAVRTRCRAGRWLMLSDVCKRQVPGCLEVPTGAIIKPSLTVS
jgi:formate dehydrogenase iron-sulfur subunit